MEIRLLKEADIESVAPYYAEGIGKTVDSGKSLLQKILQTRASTSVQGQTNHVLVAETEPGAITGLIATGAPTDVSLSNGAELQVLVVPSTGAGRRLGKALLQELKKHLIGAGVPCLWIASTPGNQASYTSAGAIEWGEAPPSQRDKSRRVRLRLSTVLGAPEIETERIRLRPWQPEDLPSFVAMCADKEVHRHLPGTLSESEALDFADRLSRELNRDGFGFWTLEELPHGDQQQAAYAGFVGLGDTASVTPVRRRVGPCLELAWRLPRESWGRGLATEAAKACLSFAFRELCARELVAYTVPENVASQRVMEKIGLVRDAGGSFEHPKLPPGHPLRAHWLFRKSRPAL